MGKKSCLQLPYGAQKLMRVICSRQARILRFENGKWDAGVQGYMELAGTVKRCWQDNRIES